jgi:hypothetical protein
VRQNCSFAKSRSLPPVADVLQARTAGVDDDALAEAIYVAFSFNTINRVADAPGLEHRSDCDRGRGAAEPRC